MEDEESVQNEENGKEIVSVKHKATKSFDASPRNESSKNYQEENMHSITTRDRDDEDFFRKSEMAKNSIAAASSSKNKGLTPKIKAENKF